MLFFKSRMKRDKRKKDPKKTNNPLRFSPQNFIMFISLLTCNYLVNSPQIKALSEHRVFKINTFKEKYSVNDLKRQTRYLKHLFYITSSYFITNLSKQSVQTLRCLSS